MTRWPSARWATTRRPTATSACCVARNCSTPSDFGALTDAQRAYARRSRSGGGAGGATAHHFGVEHVDHRQAVTWRVVQQPSRAAALVQARLHNGGEGAPQCLWDTVEPCHGHLARYVDAPRAQIVHR